MVLTAYFVSSPVSGLVSHRRLADTSAKLDTSVGVPGQHDLAVRLSAARLAALLRPPHPAPNVCDDGLRPSGWARDGKSSSRDLPDGRSKIFLQKGLDISENGLGRPLTDLPVGQISEAHFRVFRCHSDLSRSLLL